MFYIKQDGKYIQSQRDFVKSAGKWLPIVESYRIDKPVPDKEFKIYVVTDLHFKAGTDGDPNAVGAINTVNGRYYYASPNNMRDFVSIVNEEKPDLVVALGDMCDTPNDYPLFNQIWNGIDSTVPKLLTLGNHDFDDLTYDQLVTTLGYGNNPTVAGSRFNQTRTVGDNSQLIVLDATFDANDAHGMHYESIRIHTQAVAWFENILRTSPNKNFYVGIHVAPHHGYFLKTQRDILTTMITSVMQSRPDINITWLFGHHHLPDIEEYVNLGVKNKAYLLPALVLNEEGRFTEVTITKTGFNLKKRDLVY